MCLFIDMFIVHTASLDHLEFEILSDEEESVLSQSFLWQMSQ